MKLANYDMDKIATLLSGCKWMWAKTYESVPHEYIVRGKCGLSEEDFLYIVDAQRNIGVNEQWGKYNFPYLYIDGYKYWTMGNSYDVTKVINRQKVFSEFDNLSFPLSEDYSCNEWSQICHLIKRMQRKPILEIGFGNGKLPKELNLSANSYYGIDPSYKAVEEFRRNNIGFYKRVSRKSFEESVDKWKNNSHLVVALFGSASYVMGQYLKILKDSKNDYFLMFYKKDYCPQQYNSMHHFSYTLDGLKRSFNSETILEYGNYYIVTNMAIHYRDVEQTKIYTQQKLF